MVAGCRRTGAAQPYPSIEPLKAILKLGYWFQIRLGRAFPRLIDFGLWVPNGGIQWYFEDVNKRPTPIWGQKAFFR